MSDISHLDFQPGERVLSLRERALAAYHGEQDARRLEEEGHRLNLLQEAHEKCVEILDEMTAEGLEVKVTHAKDGDGEVTFWIDRLQFMVKVVYKTSQPGELQSCSLSVLARGGGWSPIDSLSALGGLLEARTVVPVEEKAA